jgi:uncharacterized ferritin-like protein (DUF455 family)
MTPNPESVRDYCLSILESGSLAAKLRPPRLHGGVELDDRQPGPPVIMDAPARDVALRLRGVAERLPSLQELRDPAARAVCLERFAHHELMAVELFAWALLTWPDMPESLRRSFVRVLEEEQRHLRLYLSRLEAHGSGLGDRPLSDYFWKHAPAMRSSPHGPLAFLSAMGLTFEQANLDFSLFYGKGFARAGDPESARAMNLVHVEEIGHVALALRWLRRLKRPGWNEITTYEQTVPFPLQASRAKGKRFSIDARRQAGLPEEFIEYVRRARPGNRPPSANEESPLGGNRRPSAPARDPGASPLTAGESGVRLWPNLGGEEKGRGGGAAASGAIRRTARLWSLLFERGVRLATGDEGLTPWPSSLGDRPPGAAFDWLPTGEKLVPWLPTRLVVSEARRLGLELAAPDPGVVRTVHDKAFALRVAGEGSHGVSDLTQRIRIFDPGELRRPDFVRRLEESLATWPAWTGQRFTLKPRLGSSGRGRVHGEGSATGRVASALPRLARQGGAILEPWLERTLDLSVQLHVAAGGDITLLGTTRQIVRTSGIVVGNRGVVAEDGAVHAGTEYDGEIVAAAREVAAAAGEQGFWGPCGTDALVFRGPGGARLLRAVVELNARFTTGTVALGLLRRAQEAGKLPPGSAWAFLHRLPGRGEVEAGSPVAILGLSGPGERVGAVLVVASSESDLDGICSRAEGSDA